VQQHGGQYMWVQPDAEDLTALADLIDDGAIRVDVARTFPLEHAAAAFRESMSGHVRGKIALTVQLRRAAVAAWRRAVVAPAAQGHDTGLCSARSGRRREHRSWRCAAERFPRSAPGSVVRLPVRPARAQYLPTTPRCRWERRVPLLLATVGRVLDHVPASVNPSARPPDRGDHRPRA